MVCQGAPALGHCQQHRTNQEDLGFWRLKEAVWQPRALQSGVSNRMGRLREPCSLEGVRQQPSFPRTTSFFIPSLSALGRAPC